MLYVKYENNLINEKKSMRTRQAARSYGQQLSRPLPLKAPNAINTPEWRRPRLEMCYYARRDDESCAAY